MLREFKSGLVGILRGLNPFDMKCSLEYSIERNSNNRKLNDIEEKFKNSTRYLYYPLTYIVCNSIYIVLNRKERVKR